MHAISECFFFSSIVRRVFFIAFLNFSSLANFLSSIPKCQHTIKKQTNVVECRWSTTWSKLRLTNCHHAVCAPDKWWNEHMAWWDVVESLDMVKIVEKLPPNSVAFLCSERCCCCLQHRILNFLYSLWDFFLHFDFLDTSIDYYHTRFTITSNSACYLSSHLRNEAVEADFFGRFAIFITLFLASRFAEHYFLWFCCNLLVIRTEKELLFVLDEEKCTSTTDEVTINNEWKWGKNRKCELCGEAHGWKVREPYETWENEWNWKTKL